MGLMLLFLICVFVGASLGLWFVQQRVRQGFCSIGRRLPPSSQRHGRNVLFLDPAQVWAGSLCACAVLALGAWLVTGSFVFAAVIAAVAFGTAIRSGAGAASTASSASCNFPTCFWNLPALYVRGRVYSRRYATVPTMPRSLSQELRLILHEQRMGCPSTKCCAIFLRVPVESVSLIVSALNTPHKAVEASPKHWNAYRRRCGPDFTCWVVSVRSHHRGECRCGSWPVCRLF